MKLSASPFDINLPIIIVSTASYTQLSTPLQICCFLETSDWKLIIKCNLIICFGERNFQQFTLYFQFRNTELRNNLFRGSSDEMCIFAPFVSNQSRVKSASTSIYQVFYQLLYYSHWEACHKNGNFFLLKITNGFFPLFQYQCYVGNKNWDEFRSFMLISCYWNTIQCEKIFIRKIY